MLKLLQSQFLRGPNIRWPRSGLLLLVENAEGAPGLAWRPAPEEAERVLEAVAASVAVAAESPVLADAKALCEAPLPAMHLLLAVAEVMLRDFCAQPETGRVLASLRRGRCTAFLPCDEQKSGLAAWAFCQGLATALPRLGAGAQPRVIDALAQAYAKARQSIRSAALNQSSIGVVRAALRRGIPHYRLSEQGQFVQLGQGRHGQRIMETATNTARVVGRTIANDKYVTSRLLHSLGLPTPMTRLAASADEAVAIADKLGYPVVVKPRNSGKGRGVSVNLRSEAEVRHAVDVALAVNAGLLVERFIEGADHRLLVIGGRFIAAARREPAQVTGDGRSTVAELVEQANRDPRRGKGFERLMQRIEMDAEAHLCLRRAGLTEQSVPATGAAVMLRGAANISRGGSSTDWTGRIHPDNARLAERAAAIVGLAVTGIDFQTPDLARSWREVRCAILEVNATPGFRPHLIADPGRDVFGALVEHLYPDGDGGRIPTVGITGSCGKTSTSRLIAAVLAGEGRCVALATTQGSWVGGELRRRGDSAGGASAAILLTDPAVEAGVFEFARGGLHKGGMALDAIDVGVVLNVHDNHIGSDGIAAPQDLARIKRLVAENARRAAVLNADDALCLAMREHVRTQVALVSRQAGNAALAAHRQAGGMGALFDPAGRRLVLFDGGREVGTLDVDDIPSTWQGRYGPAIDHALATMAAAHALGIPFERTAAVLARFEPGDATNPGRMNVYRGLPHAVLVSHVDGAAPMRELSELVRQLDVAGRKVLLLCTAGDRPDDFIAAIAHAAAGAYDRYVCSDWTELRGRQPREAARLLAGALEARGVDRSRIEVAQDLDDAVQRAYGDAGADDFIVDNSYSDSGRAAWLRARGLPVADEAEAAG